MSELRALGELVVIEPEPDDGRAASGLLLVSGAEHVFRIGRVKSVGPRAGLDLHAGDRVLYSRDMSSKHPGHGFDVAHPDVVLGVVSEDVTVTKLQPVWRGVGAQRVEVGRSIDGR